MANVLLIEPNKVLAATYQRALKHDGHHTAVASLAQEAIYTVDTRTPDIILLELQLAVHDGIEFLHELRSYPEWQGIPVILVSNTPLQHLAPLHEVLRNDLGIMHCLYKPHLTLARLLKVVREVVA